MINRAFSQGSVQWVVVKPTECHLKVWFFMGSKAIFSFYICFERYIGPYNRKAASSTVLSFLLTSIYLLAKSTWESVKLF